MNSCCHSCPKAAHLNEVSSLPHRFWMENGILKNLIKIQDRQKGAFTQKSRCGQSDIPPQKKKKAAYRFEC